MPYLSVIITHRFTCGERKFRKTLKSLRLSQKGLCENFCFAFYGFINNYICQKQSYSCWNFLYLCKKRLNTNLNFFFNNKFQHQ